MDQRYSCTSNTVKLLKHLPTLKGIQDGVVVPVMVHMMPSHRCQLNCPYCCFKNRVDKKMDMPFDVAKRGIEQFHAIGTRSIELTGGGDPTLYPQINDLIELLSSLDFNMGINTNTVDSQLIKDWGAFNWVRVSMNTLDVKDSLNIGPIKDAGAYISACYIWNDTSNRETFLKVAKFCKEEKIVCRICPDCIKPLDEIDSSVDMLRSMMDDIGENDYLFLSDFNITTQRHNNKCYIHMIKPCFYTDGYIYPCPSVELAQENNSQMPKSFALCHSDSIVDFYSKGPSSYDRGCSYCKYEKQNLLLEEVLTETTFNEFA